MLLPNLLPPKLKKQIREKQELKQFSLLLLKWFSIPLVFFVLMAGVNVYIEIIKSNLEKQSDDMEEAIKREGGDIKPALVKFNRGARILRSFERDNVKWSEFILDLSKRVPQGVRLVQLSAREDKKASIAGFSPTREGVLAFEESLKKSSFVSKLEAPLSNIVQPMNVEFRFNFVFTASE